jgi:methylated-DNA-protein-cysteine methyltransferase-like protein
MVVKQPITQHLKSKTQHISPMAVKKKTAGKLKQVKPSGTKDETFFELVYEVARQIPKGRVTSYGAIAASLGAKSSARMVGWAMNGAHNVKPKVPAHRVVNRLGILSGKHHFDPPGNMEVLLKKEGIKVENDQVVDFRKKFWDPVEELGF